MTRLISLTLSSLTQWYSQPIIKSSPISPTITSTKTSKMILWTSIWVVAVLQATKRTFRIKPISSLQLTTTAMMTLRPITMASWTSMGSSNMLMNGVNQEIQCSLRQVNTRIKITSIASPDLNLRLIRRLAKFLSWVRLLPLRNQQLKVTSHLLRNQCLKRRKWKSTDHRRHQRPMLNQFLKHNL